MQVAAAFDSALSERDIFTARKVRRRYWRNLAFPATFVFEFSIFSFEDVRRDSSRGQRTFYRVTGNAVLTKLDGSKPVGHRNFCSPRISSAGVRTNTTRDANDGLISKIFLNEFPRDRNENRNTITPRPRRGSEYNRTWPNNSTKLNVLFSTSQRETARTR